MDSYRATVFVHLFFSILLVGQALFWFIMLIALGQRFDGSETGRLLGVLNHARWPHVVIPYRLRLRLPWVTWLTTVVLVLTGVALVRFRGAPGEILWWLKMALLAAIILTQVLLTRRPSPSLIRINFGLVLAIIVVSGWAVR